MLNELRKHRVMLLIFLVASLIVIQGLNTSPSRRLVKFTFTQACTLDVITCNTSTVIYPPTGTNTIAGPTTQVTIEAWQDWDLFDIKGNQYGAIAADQTQQFPFAVASTTASFTASAQAGFIRINEHHFLENAVPSFSSGYGSYLYSVQVSGQLLVNGQQYASFVAPPFPAPNWITYQTIQAYLPNLVTAGAVFFTGDIPGTSRDSAFYMIFNNQLRPDACSQYPQSCVDMSEVVAGGKDVTLGATFQETWTQWAIDLNPAKTWLYGPCDYTPSIPIYNIPFYCVKNTDQKGPVPVSMPPRLLSSLGILTCSTNGVCTFNPTVTVITAYRNTVFFTTVTNTNGTVTKWGVKYTNTTITGTLTNPPVGGVGKNQTGSCGLGNYNLPIAGSGNLIPLPTWLCGSTLGVPNWIVLGVMILSGLFLMVALTRTGRRD